VKRSPGDMRNRCENCEKKTVKGPRKNNFRILGARIWVSFVRSGGGKTGGIASSFEDFDTPGAGEDGLKPGWIKCKFIFCAGPKGA
jgi:hypothetical protein